MKTAASYLEDGAILRRYSIETSVSPNSSALISQQRPSFNKNSTMFMRTAIVSDSDSDENDEMIRDFKRKFQKRD
jgi:hypothetical protein